MWLVDSIKIKPIKKISDVYSTVDPDLPSIQNLLFNEIRIANDVERIFWNDSTIQVILCDCGETGCAFGGYITLRQAGDYILMAFDFEDYNDLDYAPPAFMTNPGVPVLTRESYHRLNQLIPEMLAFDEVPHLTTRESLEILKWEYPTAFKMWYGIRTDLKVEDIIAVSKGTLPAQIKRVKNLLSKWSHQDIHVAMEFIQPFENPLTYYLDQEGIPEFGPILENEDAICLPIADRYAVLRHMQDVT